jgi:prepilin-type N-terminal cleavage/methylation domain-containing protein
MKTMLYKSEKGFSLVELTIVLAIIAIIMAFTAATLLKSNPIPELDNQAEKIAVLLKKARKNAISTHNQWIFQIDIQNGTYQIANDDGWKGTLTAPNASSEPRMFYTGNPDFDVSKRNNNIININERIEGPYALSGGAFFVKDYGVGMVTDIKIIFNSRGRVSTPRYIWIVDRAYPRPFPSYPTHDQSLHRRKISVLTTGMVKISN